MSSSYLGVRSCVSDAFRNWYDSFTMKKRKSWPRDSYSSLSFSLGSSCPCWCNASTCNAGEEPFQRARQIKGGEKRERAFSLYSQIRPLLHLSSSRRNQKLTLIWSHTRVASLTVIMGSHQYHSDCTNLTTLVHVNNGWLSFSYQ